MKKIKFSVLMSVYKNDKVDYVKKAVDSLLEQSVMPDQIVIMVDGIVDDELMNLLSEYSKKNSIIEIHSRNENKGLGITLNEGLKYCRHEYVARMDADDISYKDRFKKQMEFLNKNSVDVLGGIILEFDDVTEKEISSRSVPLTNNEIKEYAKKRNPMNHVSVIFKKNSVIEAGGYLDCLYFEDYYLWARMIVKGYTFANIQDNLVKVRAGLGMSGRRGNLKYIKCIINFENKLLKLKLINYVDYIINIVVRTIVSLLPNKIRYAIYQKKLRSNM